jgi:hypothetical protein
LLVVGVSIFLGLNQVFKAIFSALSMSMPELSTYLLLITGLSVLITATLAYQIFR